ncbi:unnamed protein product [Protopolystoma xenopodis]|uniref:Uncharacterized protein n=1 Tax=Protopolystoma xenopodis TaxID=117903 RepID=A0A448WU85_9PLAT|nr:unnamed protein product [Protopolystoma xenopodis]
MLAPLWLSHATKGGVEGGGKRRLLPFCVHAPASCVLYLARRLKVYFLGLLRLRRIERMNEVCNRTHLGCSHASTDEHTNATLLIWHGWFG